MAVVSCKSPVHLLEQLHVLQGVPRSGPWAFRGQALASWQLVPSLFRLNLPHEQQFEQRLIQSLRRNLQHRSTIPERLVLNDDYILALAQHYGCATRMLDWTLSPIAAAYFAASGSLRARSDQPFAVFAIAEITCEADHAKGSEIVYPPTGANTNLAAQSGLLLRHDWACRNYWKDDFDLQITESLPEVSSLLNSRFFRFELAAEFAGLLLDELQQRRGADGSVFFPGVHGLVHTAADAAWRAGIALTEPEPSDDQSDDG